MKIIVCINTIILVILIYLNFYFKNNFYELTLVSKMLDTKITKEKQIIASLNAEISYVTSPKYLGALSSKYLKLKNVERRQIVKDFKQALKLLK